MNNTYTIELVTEDEAVEHNGFTLTLIQDEDAENSNPRTNTDCNLSLFLGFEHNRYEIGDERVDRNLVEYAQQAASRIWPRRTFAERKAVFFEVLVRQIKRQYGARVVIPVGLLDHSGLHFYAGGGSHWSDSAGWDSGTCGFIFDTPEVLERTGWTGTDDELRAALVAEVEEYDTWSRGEVFGYVIQRGGEEVDSCWGFIGEENAKAAALGELAWHEEHSPALADEWFASYVNFYGAAS